MVSLNVLSQDNFLNVNISFAKLFGLQAAVYWSALLFVLSRVKSKKTFNENGFFNLDRDYIKKKTTLTTTEQLKCDKILQKAGIIYINELDQNNIRVDAQTALSYIIEGDVEEISKKIKVVIGKPVKRQTKEDKLAGMSATLKKFIVETDETLRNAYCVWVETLVGQKRLTKAAIQYFENAINSYTQDNNVKKSLIEIATAHLYIDAQWAIKRYESMYGQNVQKDLINKQKTEEIDELVDFG